MPNLKIGIEEHDFLRKIITEKYQQKDTTWSSGGSINNYESIAAHIRQSVKKQIGSVSISPHQLQKLFACPVESIYRDYSIEACYLYCGLKRNVEQFGDDGKGGTSSKEEILLLQQEVEDFKTRLQESENRADALQKEMDRHMEQNEALHQEMETQNRLYELLKNDLETHQNQLQALEARFIEQGKAVHHYVSLLKYYEHQKVVSEGELQNLKQIIATLTDENQRLIAEKTVHKKSKKTFAKILFII